MKMAGITEEEKLLLPKFREKVEDLLHDELAQSDEYLVRWIRDRDLNLNAAEIMLRKHFVWRNSNKMNAILPQDLDDSIHVQCPFKLDSYDREGKPVLEMPAGIWQSRELIDAGRGDLLGRQVYRMMEEVLMANLNCQDIKSEGSLLLSTSIVDLDHLSYKQLGTKEALTTTVHIIKAVCENYPEVLQTNYIINAPTFFTIIFKILKAVIPSRYISRTYIFGKCRDDWEPVLLNIIPPEQLRKKYGGMKEN